MGSVLVLGPIGGIAESLDASRHFALVRLFPGVGAQVGFQVLQPRVRLGAPLELWGD